MLAVIFYTRSPTEHVTVNVNKIQDFQPKTLDDFDKSAIYIVKQPAGHIKRARIIELKNSPPAGNPRTSGNSQGAGLGKRQNSRQFVDPEDNIDDPEQRNNQENYNPNAGVVGLLVNAGNIRNPPAPPTGANDLVPLPRNVVPVRPAEGLEGDLPEVAAAELGIAGGDPPGGENQLPPPPPPPPPVPEHVDYDGANAAPPGHIAQPPRIEDNPPRLLEVRDGKVYLKKWIRQNVWNFINGQDGRQIAIAVAKVLHGDCILINRSLNHVRCTFQAADMPPRRDLTRKELDEIANVLFVVLTKKNIPNAVEHVANVPFYLSKYIGNLQKKYKKYPEYFYQDRSPEAEVFEYFTKSTYLPENDTL